MPTHNDIKTAAYLDPIINYAEAHLGIRFKRTGDHRYSAFCPFHADTKDSFRLYVDGNDVVRFHCFGECKGDWDIYDVIMLREKCSFRQAQQIWADYLGLKDVNFYRGESQHIPEPDAEPEPDDSVEFLEPAEPDDQIKATLAEAAGFYNELLLSDPEKYSKVLTYLARRGVEKSIIERFQIGYSPAYADAEHRGRALINAFLERFDDDYRTFRHFQDGCLVRLLNDKGARGYGYYLQQIDFTTRSPFARNYGDYFAGRIVFPIRNAASRGNRFHRQTPRQSRYPLAQATGRRECHHHEKLALRHRQGLSLHQALPDGDPGGGHLRLFRLLSPAAGPGPAGGGVHSGFISFRRGDGHFQVAWGGALYRRL